MMDTVLGAIIASMTHFIIGTIIGLPAVTLTELTNPETTDIFLNTSQVALFSSIIHIGAAMGSLIAGAMNLRLGQRVTLLLTLPATLLLWIILAFSPAVWMVLLVRAFLGAAQGFIGAASSNYVVEIADSNMRGRLSGIIDTCRQIGFLLVYVIGTFNLTWRQISVVCGCVTCIPPFIGLFFLPNSPRWLVTRGRIEEAEKAFTFYRGSHFDVRPELKSVINQFENTTANKTSVREQFHQMLQPGVYPRFILLAFLMFVVHFTGNIAIATFVVPIFQAANAQLDPYASAVLIGSFRVAGTIAFLLIVDHVGRRTALLFSSAACTTSLVALGAYFYLQNGNKDVTSVSWLPLTSLLFYTPFVCAIQAVTSLLRGEILPTALRALGASIMYVVFFTGMFASTQTFPEMITATGEEGAFWVFGGCCVLMAVVVAITLPETKGLSLEQIDDLFRSQNQESLKKLQSFESKVP
ncbi:hypothetical protein SK128_001258 [Halocaridina rubra]|uniref:Major facilitator superfamily (MFS) profile domain-containing protein n=1 Tax=Halocaridina rubra TaxID=373956 RepID=A0AAN9A2Y1_HALRR